jgi:hypothetical protein
MFKTRKKNENQPTCNCGPKLHPGLCRQCLNEVGIVDNLVKSMPLANMRHETQQRNLKGIKDESLLFPINLISSNFLRHSQKITRILNMIFSFYLFLYIYFCS